MSRVAIACHGLARICRCCCLVATLLLPIAGSAAELAPVAVGITNTSSDVGFFIADKRGYFRAEGIAISLTPFNSAAQMVAPLGSGQLDVGGGTVAAGLYNAVGRGIKIRIVADKGSIKPGYGYSMLMVRQDLVASGRYHSLKDLKGMKIAISAPGTGTESALNEALKKGGLGIGDVELTYLGYPDHLLAYRNRGIDASITNEPTATLAAREGVAVRIAGNDELYPDQQTAVVLYSDEFSTVRHDVAQRFMDAYIRALRDYVDALQGGKLAGPGADAIIAILTAETPVKDAAIYRDITPNWVNPDGHVNGATLANDLAFFKQQGLITAGNVQVSDVVDDSFVAASLVKLGVYPAKPAR